MTEEEIVSKQLHAYNNRDIDTFMETWAEDSRYYEHPNTLLAHGHGEIRNRHVERFKDEDLFGRLLSRVVVGTTVVDHETVTRNFPEGLMEVDVVAIYDVSEHKIQNAWFIFGEKRLVNSSKE